MNDDDKLRRLGGIAPDVPSAAARSRAVLAAMQAFDEANEKSRKAPQGAGWAARLRSILSTRGNWIMDTRIPLGLGTAAVALLLLPLGYQLYISTALTPPSFNQHPPVSQTTGPLATTPGSTATETEVDTLSANQPKEAEPAPVSGNAPELVKPGLVDGRADATLAEERKSVGDDANFAIGVASKDEAGAAGIVMKQQAVGGAIEDSAAAVMAPMTVTSEAAGIAAPVPEPTMRPMTDPTGNEFTDFTESPLKIVANEPVSTFSIDVDTASYSYVRRMLNEGYLPEPDAVRIEELINYFDYSYPLPDSAREPFKPTIQVYPTPWNPKTELLQIGIKGYVPPVTEDKAANLTFLIDTSGSMDEPDKLPLLKRAFGLLVDQLGANDTVSIVVYAGSAGVVLEPTSASEKNRILSAIDSLSPGGSTAGAEGIELAYQLAEQHKVNGGINRVILATDGDFNVGISDPDQLIDFVKQKRESGVFLSVLGFGSGNYQDDTMQALAQNGNGNAAYIDSFKEAQKVLVEEIGGTLETIAKDVKIQVEFNPAVVSEYRLVGYETRALNREDFNNDKVDAGDIGAGTTVTAIYEITPVGSGGELNDPLRYGAEPATPTAAVLPSDEIGFLKLRYKLPEGDASTLMETPITKALAVDNINAASEDSRWAAAVAAFAQNLKGSNYGGTMSYDDIKALAQGARGTDEDGYRAEFIQLINQAKSVDGSN